MSDERRVCVTYGNVSTILAPRGILVNPIGLTIPPKIVSGGDGSVAHIAVPLP